MKSFLKTNELIEALNNRYAVKKFEKRNLSEAEKSEPDMLIVFAVPTNFDRKFIEKHTENLQKIR